MGDVVTFNSANHTAGGGKVVRLNQNDPVGAAKSLKVYPGDKVDMEVYSYFESSSGYGTGNEGASAMAAVASASLTGNWLLQSTKPTANETYNFLSGHGISIGGGYIGGVNWTISPTNDATKNALGFGAYTPQIGASYNYTPGWLIFNKK